MHMAPKSPNRVWHDMTSHVLQETARHCPAVRRTLHPGVAGAWCKLTDKNPWSVSLHAAGNEVFWKSFPNYQNGRKNSRLYGLWFGFETCMRLLNNVNMLSKNSCWIAPCGALFCSPFHSVGCSWQQRFQHLLISDLVTFLPKLRSISGSGAHKISNSPYKVSSYVKLCVHIACRRWTETHSCGWPVGIRKQHKQHSHMSPRVIRETCSISVPLWNPFVIAIYPLQADNLRPLEPEARVYSK